MAPAFERRFAEPALVNQAPAGLGPAGFDQAHGRSRTLAQAIERHDAMNEAWGGMLDNGLGGGPAYDLARDRFNALRETARDRANAESRHA